MPSIRPTTPVAPPPIFGRAEEFEAPRRARVPLKGERMRIVVRGRLVLVSREQVFRNDEDRSIEATLTFPVPVHATLHRLTARIGERTLTAKALRRDAARETYEKAVEDGKTAVLHEELVRGVHVLSVAHIGAGATIAVTHAWIAALAPGADGRWLVRIPVTVGDVYGVSPFNDADDLTTSPHVVHEAQVEVDCGDAVASIGGAPLPAGGSLGVVLEGPVDLEIAGSTDMTAAGVAADGRRIEVMVTPDTGGDAAIDAAILVDRSGSMAGTLSAVHGAATKHAAVIAGLTEAAGALGLRDRAELWEFDNATERVGAAGVPLAAAIDNLGAPRGGTEIGSALSTVVQGSRAADIVLITDGLSHALDVQALANTGRRFSIVLVGNDSFEANVGRLAAMTGGQIFLVGHGCDVAAAVRAAIASVRRPKALFETATWPIGKATTQCAGATVVATWKPEADLAGTHEEFATAVGAFAAALALPLLPAQQAAQVTVDHGIVSHLTSLVLVDEAGDSQSELPAQRKIPLMMAGTAAPHRRRSVSAPAPPSLYSMAAPAAAPIIAATAPNQGGAMPAAAAPGRVDRGATGIPLADIARRIDWGADPEALRRGDLTGVAPDLAKEIVFASKTPEVIALAGPNGNALAIVIGLLAKSRGPWNRAGARLAKVVLRGLDAAAIAAARAALGL